MHTLVLANLPYKLELHDRYAQDVEALTSLLHQSLHRPSVPHSYVNDPSTPRYQGTPYLPCTMSCADAVTVPALLVAVQM